MSDDREWEELVERHLRGELDEDEMERLAERLDSDPAARRNFVEISRWDTQLGEQLRAAAGAGPAAELDVPSLLLLQHEQERAATGLLRRLVPATWQAPLLGTVLVSALGLIVWLAVRQARAPETPPQLANSPAIARVVGVGGALMWTGDGGQIATSLRVGRDISGGTIEGLAPDSWFAIEFTDGTTATIAGDSTLTFSEQRRKELHLRKGTLSASVVPQPPGAPLRVHTPSAVLEVLGTQFKVETERSATVLNVSRGRVQVRRLSDGRTVNVPAAHRLVAAADGDFTPQPVPGAATSWTSRLPLGPRDLYGQWHPATDREPAGLRAVPFIPPENPQVTLQMLGLPVSREDCSPVFVDSRSRFRVRGRLGTAHKLFLGIRVVRADGEFAGKFLTQQQVSPDDRDGRFEVEFSLDQFRLDPCVYDRKDELPARPHDLYLTCMWCFTVGKRSSQLELFEVELFPAAEGSPLRPPPAD